MDAVAPEVLALIFEHACPPVFPEAPPYDSSFTDPYPLLTLTHVSSYWRRVAWSAPHLWCDLLLFVTNTSVHGIVPILELHLQNARDLPFNLDLRFDPRRERTNQLDQTTKSLGRLIFTNLYSKNLRSLQLIYPPSFDWDSLIVKKCSRLEHLSITRDIGGTSWQSEFTFWDDKLSLAELTNLRHVVLDYIDESIVLPWSSITDLDLCRVPVDFCMKALVNCPNLIRFLSIDPMYPQKAIEDVDPPNSPIILNALREFTWTLYPQCDFFIPLFHHIHIPALHSLCWIGNYKYCSGTDRKAREIFRNLPNTLCTLRLEELDDWTHDLFRYAFTKAHSVRELTVTTASAQITQTLLDVLCLAQDDEARGTQYLPLLTTLTIEDSHDTTTSCASELHNETFSHQLLKMWQKRFSEPHSRFRIEFKYCWVVLDEGVQEELALMVQRGSHLEVVDGRGKCF